jgi:DNA-binding response OmpR family regulator
MVPSEFIDGLLGIGTGSEQDSCCSAEPEHPTPRRWAILRIAQPGDPPLDVASIEPQSGTLVALGGRVRHIVVVEGDTETRRSIQEALEEDGFRVTSFSEGESLLAMITTHHPDLVVLALMLPGVQGLEVIRHLQDHGRIPSIVVSWKGSEMDRVVGLELGADDYLAKPFSPRELLARVHAVLRRSEDRVECETLEYEGITIDLTTREVVVGGRAVELTALEFDLLVFLAASPRQVFSRETLLDRVWGSSSEWQTTGTVSEIIHRIRRKIEPNPTEPRWIETVRGVGYRFALGAPERHSG